MSNQQRKSAATPFCKFCEGAGESKKVYTSHWQFSKPEDGVLTCPKLLKYTCKLCKGNGHIEKRCPNPKQKQERSAQFCRFCYNAKNTDFISHNQFDENGFIQCPTLLNIECQNCGEKGHTKRYCNEIKADAMPKANTMPKKVAQEPYVAANKFACLIVKEDDTLQTGNLSLFPMLSERQENVKATMGGWMNAVKGKPEPESRPAPPSRPPPSLPETVILCKEKLLIPPTKPLPQLPLPQLPEHEPISDSEDEDEEDYPIFATTPYLTSWAESD